MNSLQKPSTNIRPAPEVKGAAGNKNNGGAKNDSEGGP